MGAQRPLERPPPFLFSRNFPLLLPWRETAAASRRHSNTRYRGPQDCGAREDFVQFALPRSLGFPASDAGTWGKPNFSRQEPWPRSPNPPAAFSETGFSISPLVWPVAAHPAFHKHHLHSHRPRVEPWLSLHSRTERETETRRGPRSPRAVSAEPDPRPSPAWHPPGCGTTGCHLLEPAGTQAGPQV